MKTTFLIGCLVIALAFKSYATDLLVEEFGLAPAYSSITAAVGAATDGDRIIIKNRNGGSPWVENVTINKSLQLLPFINDSFFVVQGNYTIVPADNREITIIGMRNTNGGIAATVIGNTAARTKVNIMGSLFVLGNIALSQNGFLVNTVHTKLNAGTIAIKAGNVIGCDITTLAASQISINIGAETVVTNEVIKIVANKITNLNAGAGSTAISFATNTHLADIRNNLMFVRNTGIAIPRTKTAEVLPNKIINNTISISGAPLAVTVYGINITTASATSITDVMNNLIDLSSSGVATTGTAIIYGITSTSTIPTVNVLYNTIDDSIAVAKQIMGPLTTNANNTSSPVTVNTDGQIIGTGGINNGNPAVAYYDLDLSISDCGAYGGSFTLDNYFPMHTGAARVYMVTVPANVRVGGTISIQADGYDR